MLENGPKLDRIDLKIIEVLQSDARISYQKLAELVHLTPRPCQERVRKLERMGVIRGYTALIDLDTESKGLVLHLQVALMSQRNRSAQQAFEAALQQDPDVLDCWLVGGSFDYIVRLHCQDMDGYREISNRWLAEAAFCIERIICTPEMQTVKRHNLAAAVSV
ncbi:Lrp/AsnC family transcriptional regulator [Leeia oryzae]|uniref:Lrp/AsnC family transcriptional regulator n=1 Tax=Leeia oryzae TaxID=356662 RepID=UPI00036F7AD4|nr:Lrp/AsnC family transcriptional regulator [Leeia oryzae]